MLVRRARPRFNQEIEARALYGVGFRLSIGVNALDIVVTTTHLLNGRQRMKRCFISGFHPVFGAGRGSLLARPWFNQPSLNLKLG